MRRGLSLLLLALTTPLLHAAEQGIRLLYGIEEAGQAAGQQRMLITRDWLRMDEGDEAASYLLYDRRAQVVYNISHQDRLVLVITSGPMPAEDAALQVELKRTQDQQAPAVAGREVQNVELWVNGRLCERRAVVPDLLPDAVAALAEFQRALAFQQSASLTLTPAELRDDCESLRLIHQPDRLPREGLALLIWRKGHQESLLDFAEGVAMEPALLEIPADYPRKSLPSPAQAR